MCLKKLRRYDDAISTYNVLRDVIAKTEGKLLIRSVFSVITLFTNQDRSKQSEQLENLKTVMDFYSHPKYENQESLIPWYVPNDGWKSDKIEQIIKAIKNRSFFGRFS
jgi:hypothetical protein